MRRALLALLVIGCSGQARPVVDRGPELSALRERQMLPLAEHVHEQLVALVQRYGGTEEDITDAEAANETDRLRLYLVLTGPRSEREPAISEAAIAWVELALDERLTAPLTEPQRVRRNEILQLWAADAGHPIARDVELIANVRAVLNRRSLVSTTLASLAGRCERQSLSFADLVDEPGAITIDPTVQVEGVYTRDCWETKVARRLEDHDELVERAWVLARPVPGDDKLQQLRRDYVLGYIRAWRLFVSALRIAPPNGEALNAAREQIAAMTGSSPPPLEVLLRAIARQAEIVAPPAATGPSEDPWFASEPPRMSREVLTAFSDEPIVADGVSPWWVRYSLEGFTDLLAVPGGGEASDIDNYHRVLRELLVLVVRRGLGATRPTDRAELEDAQAQVGAMIERAPVAWRPSRETLLRPPIDLVVGAL
jgi:type VI secretion system protein ImpL